MINLFKYYVDMENCESFKDFDYIYIYIYELFCYIIGIFQCEARLGFFAFPSENPLIDPSENPQSFNKIKEDLQ